MLLYNFFTFENKYNGIFPTEKILNKPYFYSLLYKKVQQLVPTKHFIIEYEQLAPQPIMLSSNLNENG